MKQTKYPLLPIRDQAIFPHTMTPFFVGRERSTQAVERAMKEQADIVLVAQKDAEISNPSLEELYSFGTLCSIIQVMKLPDGNIKVLMEGKKRVEVVAEEERDGVVFVEVKPIVSSYKTSTELDALIRYVKTSFEKYVKLDKRIPPEALMKVTSLDHPEELANVIASQLNLKLDTKQKVLEVVDAHKQLDMILDLMLSEVEILEVEKRIKSRVKDQVEKSQKEYYLNEQMQAIQRELGEKDDVFTQTQELLDILKEKKMSKELKGRVEKEIKKLRSMSPMSSESSVLRNYIDWVLCLPWGKLVESNYDLKHAENILNEDHWGLEKVKERIVEQLAVQALTKSEKSSVLCLVGPPGVGKTSLAKSVARALGRPFIKVSLGGVRDEGEIRGHRRTYVGAMPGRIIQGLKKSKFNNPVILLDEIDKISSDFRGDPSSALLEVLDSEQNKMFSDHFLEFDYDLSNVLFFATANSLHPLARPLLDRMEVISLEGYIDEEKVKIAEKYLVPKQIKSHGLKGYKVGFSQKVLMEIIRFYTKEAGVRGLERTIASICRKLAKKIYENISKKSPSRSYRVSSEMVNRLVGPPKYKDSKTEAKNQVGLTNGLAWTEVGGDILPIEVSVVSGKGQLILTGQLGDVMKESCTAAMTYVRSRSELLGFNSDFYVTKDVHIHVPEGSIPKDGPSAGIAMVTSLVSAFSSIPVKRTVAMTGEVTLRGRVLPIGGLKEKLLAAYRAGVKEVFVPQENEKDLLEVPKKVLEKLKICLVNNVDQVLFGALYMKDAQELFKKPHKSFKEGVDYVPPVVKSVGTRARMYVGS